MPSSTICVDANLVVRRLADADDIAVRGLWQRWEALRATLVAPVLLRYEVANAFHRLAYLGLASLDTMKIALDTALALPIELVADDDLHRRALLLANQFNRPAAYDAHYLALAERLGAEFWTADKRLANAVRPHLPWVHLLGE